MNPSDESQETSDSAQRSEALFIDSAQPRGAQSIDSAQPRGAQPIDDVTRARQLHLLHETEEMFEALAQHQVQALQAKIQLLFGGKLGRLDVQQLIRGQLLVPDEDAEPPCAHDGRRFGRKDQITPAELRRGLAGKKLNSDAEDRLFERLHELPQRTAAQVGDPRHPPACPPDRLRCPLKERALAGDSNVPCGFAMRNYLPVPRLTPDRNGPRRELKSLDDVQPSYVDEIIHAELRPCMVVSEFIFHNTHELIMRPARPAPAAPEPLAPLPKGASADLRPRVARRSLQVYQQQAAEAERAEIEGARAGLRFLTETERLPELEIQRGLLDYGVLITHQGWLPCRDSHYRDLVASPKELAPENPEDPFDHLGEGPSTLRSRVLNAPKQRRPCPLMERAWSGDRTTPCCEALKQEARPDWLGSPLADPEYPKQRAAHHNDNDDADDHRPPPVYWQRPEEAPGAPQDPVITAGMRPCYLLGKVVFADLYDMMVEFCKQEFAPIKPLPGRG